jgi:ABC-type Zn2+ transport system substrate-binding protein/surface adhesin
MRLVHDHDHVHVHDHDHVHVHDGLRGRQRSRLWLNMARTKSYETAIFRAIRWACDVL